MFSFVNPQPLVGLMQPNELLKNPVKILEGKLPGPEHLLARDGAIFTALGNGDVVKIVGDNITVVGNFCCEFKFASIMSRINLGQLSR